MLKVKNLKKSYNGDIVLDSIDINIKSGEIIAVMGPSGCGKSTFIRCINRLVEPDSGEIFFKNTPIHELSQPELEKIRQNIGFVFQHFNLVQRLTVEQNVALGLIKNGNNRETAYQKTKKALKNVDLQDLSDTKIKNLSGGEKQRVGIARALVLAPDLILLDEPTASLDPILVREILELMEEIAYKREDTSMIVVTHQVAFARKVADRVFLMDNGHFIESGLPGEIFDTPQSWIGRKYKKLINYN